MNTKIIISIIIGVSVVLYGLLQIENYESYHAPDTHIAPVIDSVEEKGATVIAVGDIMLGRKVETFMTQQGDSYPFADISEFLKSADAVVGNLEGPIVKNHIHTPDFGFQFAFDPKVVPLLKSHNIQIVSLANNHSYDYGPDGYQQSRAFIRNGGIDTFGHYYESGSNYAIRKTIGGKKFIFIGYNLTNPQFNQEQALTYVKGIKKEEGEIMIAFNHGGTEYSTTSGSLQQKFYRNLIDSGVDIVIGAHPHVTQEIEIYNGKPIFYSLGNFIFDQYFSKDVEQGLALRFHFNENKTSVELIPIQSYQSQPALMNDEKKKVFLEAVANRSSKEYQDQIRNGVLILSR
jgi:poly-gamma-glutamate synthesis protein (capsule biosynthesis protein)